MPQMTSDQRAAFDAANSGQSFAALDVGQLVVGAAIALILIWMAWVAIGAYTSLRTPGTNVSDAAGKLVRAVFIAMVLIAFMALDWS